MNYGDNGGDGTLEQDGANIPATAGTYKITFDEKGDRNLAHVVWIVKDNQFVPYWDPLTGKDL